MEVINDTTPGSTLDLTREGDFGLDAIMTEFANQFDGAEKTAILAVEDSLVSEMSDNNLLAEELDSLDVSTAAANALLGAGVTSDAETAVETGTPITSTAPQLQLTLDSAAVTQMLENVAADTVIGELSVSGDVEVTGIELAEGGLSSSFSVVETDGGGWELRVADGAEFEADDFAETGLSLAFKVTTADGVSISRITLEVLNVEAFDGAVVKGPLEDALVFIDVDADGEWDPEIDSEQVRTDATGAFEVEVYIPDGSNPEIVAVSDGTARDASSGEYLTDGTTLSAPEGATVVTPMTTLVAEAGLEAADVAAALGLPEGVDP